MWRCISPPCRKISVYARQCRAREPPIGQQDHRCATTRSVAVAAVQRLVITEASPTPAFGRITGFDVFLERHDRNPALHRDRPHGGGAGSRSPKTALPEQHAHHGGNPRKADDRKHQFGYSSSVASRTHYPPRHPGGRLDVSKMFPRWHSARRLFVKVMSIVRKDRLTEAAMDAVRRKLHEFRMNLTHNLFESLSRGFSLWYRL
jgi:hypothetical protein